MMLRKEEELPNGTLICMYAAYYIIKNKDQ